MTNRRILTTPNLLIAAVKIRLKMANRVIVGKADEMGDCRTKSKTEFPQQWYEVQCKGLTTTAGLAVAAGPMASAVI